jgi:hypothetical protein
MVMTWNRWAFPRGEWKEDTMRYVRVEVEKFSK